MECQKHPGKEAVALCASCGIPMCEYCSVDFMNMPHCKRCTKMRMKQMMRASKMQVPPAFVSKKPRPIGKPIPGLFNLGLCGAVLLFIAGPLIGLFLLQEVNNIGFIHLADGALDMGGIILSIGLFLTGFGYYGFYRNYGFIQGLVAFVFSIIGSIFFMAALVFGMDFSESGFNIGVEFLGAAISLGISFLFMTDTLSKVKWFIKGGKLIDLAIILNLITALLFLTIFPAIIFGGMAYFFIALAGGITAFVFLIVRVPSIEEPEEADSAQIGIKEQGEVTLKPENPMIDNIKGNESKVE